LQKNETACRDASLHSVVVQNVALVDVGIERRLQVIDGDEVCSTVLELPFGYNAVVNVSIEKTGRTFIFYIVWILHSQVDRLSGKNRPKYS
jgi:hypothetical protein